MKFTPSSSTFVLLLILGLFTSCKRSDNLAVSSPDTEEWEQLFNGEDMAGWDIKIRNHPVNENFGNTFRVEDGILQARFDEYEEYNETFGHIFYNQSYSFYRLEVEYRFIGEQVQGGPAWAFRNNGIMFHSEPAQSMTIDQDFPNSIEYQLLGGNGENDRSNGNVCTPGTHIVVNGELRTEHCTSSNGPTHHGDQWVTAELVVYGDSLIQHVLNGEQVMEYENPQLDNGTLIDRGYIALQAESHPTDFRSIRILNLKGCMDPDAKNYKSYFVKNDPEHCEY